MVPVLDDTDGMPFKLQRGRRWVAADPDQARHPETRVHRQWIRGGTLIVSNGLGTTGPPVRLGVAPEIVVIRLRRA